MKKPIKKQIHLNKNIDFEQLNKNLREYMETFSSKIIEKKLKLSQKQKVNEISRWYTSGRLVMVLGAGASASYGLPSWNTLLQKLLLITLESDKDKKNTQGKEKKNEKAGILASTFTNIFEPNSLVTARYLHSYFKKEKPTSELAFENAIREAL